MSARIFYFLYLLAGMIGGSTLLLYLFFGDWFKAQWESDPFRFWFITTGFICLAVSGAAKRALYAFHPDTREAQSAK